MMRIFFVAPIDLDCPGGVSAYVLGLLKSISRQSSCKVGLLTVLCSRKPLSSCEDLKDCFTMDGPKTYHWNPWFANSAWLDKIEEGFGHPDMVHFHDLYYPLQSALAIQMNRRGWKYIVSLHGGLQDGHQNRKFIKKALGNIFFLNSFLTNSEAVHVLNETEKLSFQKKFPYVRTFVLPNGISVDTLSMSHFLSGMEVLPRSQAFLRVGFIGRLDIHNKGIDILLKAVKLLQECHPGVSMEFIFVGSFYTNRDKIVLNNLICSLNDPAKIVLTGTMTGRDKWEMLASFDVFVHTSRYEGMPGAVIEAMAFGKPCLVTPGTNMQTIVLNCEGGWACEASSESIAKALLLIAADRKEILRRGINAQKYVCEHLAWDKIAKSYVQQVERLL